MGEIVALVALAAAGVGCLAPVSRAIPRIALGAMAFPIGATVYAILAGLGLILIGRVEPVPTVLAAVATGLVGVAVAAATDRLAPSLWVTGGVVVGAAALTAWFFWVVPLTRLTIDSMRYLISAFDLQLSDGVAVVQPADLLKRQLALPSWQALSSLTERRYVAGVGPLFGISGVVLLGWLVATRSALESRRTRTMLVVAAVAFALASNRLLYDWFYINTHIEMAVLILMAVVGLWLATTQEQPAWAFPSGVALAGLLLLRPESPLVVALVLVAFAPAIRSTATAWLVLSPPLVVGATWYGVTLWSYASGGSEIGFDAPVFMGLVALGGASVVVAAAPSERLAPLVVLARRLLIPIMATALVVYTVLDPATTVDSIVATARNVGYQGLWEFTWTVAVPLLAVALLVQRLPQGTAWVTVITGYGLLFFLLPHLRESPWRLGAGDSGNRILAHVFLVVVAFLVLAAFEHDEPESSSQ